MVALDRHDVLDLDSYRRVVVDGEQVEIAPELLRHVDKRRAAMLAALEAGAPAYGVTTGLGYMIVQGESNLDAAVVIAGMITIGLVGATIDYLMRAAEGHVRRKWGQ